jgi:hypothetical protein
LRDDPIRWSRLSIVAVASLAFGYFCPEAVRKYPSAVEYALAESLFFESDRHWGYLRERVATEFNALSHSRQYVSGIFENRSLADQGLQKQEMIPGMTLLWHIMDTTHPVIRYVTAVLYGVGFLLVAIPSVLTFLGVTEALLKR